MKGRRRASTKILDSILSEKLKLDQKELLAKKELINKVNIFFSELFLPKNYFYIVIFIHYSYHTIIIIIIIIIWVNNYLGKNNWAK